ncbi:MAG: response regulator [Planctomycetes bacterium]|nr:response regulator [Planctomycetota bacterium]
MDAQERTPRRGKVLVVDDHEDGRLVLADLLTGEGFEPAAAATASEALDLMATFAPDVVVLDLLMPQTGGLQLAPELRRRERVPLLAYTGVVEPRLLERARAVGFDRVITKPDLPGLIEAITDVLDRRAAPARRARARHTSVKRQDRRRTRLT